MSNADDFGKYDERIKWARHLVHLVPDRANALAELGDAYMEIGELELAESWIARAEQLSLLQAYKARARLLWVRKDYANFMQLTESAVARDPPIDGKPLTPPQSAVVPIAALANLHAGNYAQSVKYMASILESPALMRRGPYMRMYARAFLARAYRANGEEAKAQSVIDEALRIGEKCRQQGMLAYPPLSRQLAVHHALQGDREKALKYLTHGGRRGLESLVPGGTTTR